MPPLFLLSTTRPLYGVVSVQHCNIIKRLENAAARAITGNYDFINVRGDTLFNDLGLTRFNDRYKYQTALLMFKAIHGIASAYNYM